MHKKDFIATRLTTRPPNQPYTKHRLIAFYLPQFHPFPENDEWWGKGFTEWTNVTKAKPQFKGHYQPHLPTDLGFYDLRVPEVRNEQAKMAREYGIYGFCYYHYWFNGHLLMERPLEDMLASREPDFPFMFCWANENWTKAWDGDDKETLIVQNYSEEDDLNHIRYLLRFFRDPRYIRIDGKPVVVIYRSTRLPNLSRTVEIWREEAVKENIELYILRAESFNETGVNYLSEQLDGAIEFSPHRTSEYDRKTNNPYKYLFRRGVNKFYRKVFGHNLLPVPFFDYADYVEFQKQRVLPSYKYYPSVTPCWDNTPRRNDHRFTLWYGSTPELFKIWLHNVLRKFVPYSTEENLVFINAWNEWGEGNHLEPDRKYGRQWLEAVKEAEDTLSKIPEMTAKKR